MSCGLFCYAHKEGKGPQRRRVVFAYRDKEGMARCGA